MIDEKHKVLIHRAIDGELSDHERVEFDQLLQSSPEALSVYRQLAELAALPSRLPASEAPVELKGRILKQVVVDSRRKPHRGPSDPRSIGAMIGTLLTPRLVYGLAAGLIIGIGLGALVLRGPAGHLDPMDLSGTIVVGDDPKTLKRVDSDSFAEAQAKGRLAVDVASDLAYIQLELQSTTDVSIVIDFDPAAYAVRAFEQQMPLPSATATAPGQIRTSHVGMNRYLFVLGRSGESSAPVILRVESGASIYQRELVLK